MRKGPVGIKYLLVALMVTFMAGCGRRGGNWTDCGVHHSRQWRHKRRHHHDHQRDLQHTHESCHGYRFNL